MPSSVTGSGSVVTILSENFELDNDQIKALPTTPIVVVPAISGKILSFVKAVLFIDVRAGAYTNIDEVLNVQFAYASGNTVSGPILDIVNDLVDPGDVWFAEVGCDLNVNFGVLVISNLNSLADCESQSLRIKATNGNLDNFTGGHADNRIYGSVSYEIIEV